MEKDNNQRKTIQEEQQCILPNLRKTQSAVKNLMTLAKVELDKNVVNLEEMKHKSSRQTITSISSRKLTKQVSSQNSQAQFSKTYRKFHQSVTQRNKYYGMAQQKSASINNLGTEPRQSMNKTHSHSTIIEKAKTSVKQIGKIKGYAVNSHPGPLNSFNEDRICVVTNLNKSTQRQLQISFFSIYDGQNGIAKAQFFRDHFHTTLVKDRNFFKDIELAIRKCLIEIEQSFNRLNTNGDISNVSILIAIFVDNAAYIASLGENKVLTSVNFGFQIANPLNKLQQTKRRAKLRNSHINPQFNNINIVRQNIESLDFMVLGSEGLFENLDQQSIGNKVWAHLLQNCKQNFHIMLGEVTNAVMHEAFLQMSTKNVSMILIVFQKVEECFQQNLMLQLPYANIEEQTIQQI